MKRIRHILKHIASQGLTTRDLSLAVALGFTLGLFPVLGATSLLCLGAAGIFRLNLPVIQAVNWLAAPLQLLLIVPFMKYGAGLLGMESAMLTPAIIEHIGGLDPVTIIKEFGSLASAGVLAWSLAAVPVAVLGFGITFGLLSILRPGAGGLSGADGGLR